MIQFVCENCAAIKKPNEVWIAGHAAEAVGAVSARREITIQSSWNHTTIFHPFAVHFCSIQCKDEFMARLFTPDASAIDVEEHVPIVPAEVAVETVMRGARVVTIKARKGRRSKRAA